MSGRIGLDGYIDRLDGWIDGLDGWIGLMDCINGDGWIEGRIFVSDGCMKWMGRWFGRMYGLDG